MRSQSHIRQFEQLKRRQRLGRLLWLGGFVLLALALAHWLSGWMLRPLIQRHLARQTGASVWIDSAYWVGPATVRLEEVVIAADPNRLADSALVRIRRADCSLSPAALLRMRLEVRSVSVEEAVVQVLYDHDRGRWNFSSLPFMDEPRQPSKVPVVYLDDALLRVQTRQGDRVQTLTSIGLQGQILSEERGCRYRFSLEATPRVAFYGSRIDGIWTREKGRGQVTLVGQVKMPLTYIYGNAWNLDDIRLDCRYQKDRLALDRLSCSIGQGRVNLWGDLLGPPGNRKLDLQAELENLSLSRTSRPDTVVYSREVLSMLDPGLQRFLRRFQPEGPADVRVQIRGRLSDLADSQINGQILCRDIAILDQKFPYPLEHMTGIIELTGRNLVLDNLRARHQDSEFVITGGVDNLGRQARVRTRVACSNLELTDTLRQALPPRLQQAWFEFAPSGRCAVDYEYQRKADRPGRQQLTVDLLETSGLWDRYPYPLRRLTGTILFDPNNLTLQNVVSRPDDRQRILIDGTIRGLRRPAPTCDLRIRTQRLALDQTFRNTFRKAQRQMLSEFAVDGQMNLDLNVRGTVHPGGPIPYRAHAEVQADSLQWSRFPLPLRDVTMTLSFSPERMDIESLSAACGQGRFQFKGRIQGAGADPARPGGTVSFSADELPLDEPFWKAMEAAQIYPALFSQIRAEGLVDADGQIAVNDPQSSQAGTRMMIHFKEGRLVGPQSGWTSGPAAGTIRIEDGRIELIDWSLRQTPVNPALFQIPAIGGGMLSGLDLSAMLDVTLPRAVWRREVQPAVFEASGRVDIRRGASARLSLDRLEGFWEGQIARRLGRPAFEGSGRFGAPEFQILGRTVTDLAGEWTADPNTRTLVASNITASCCQGPILGHVEIRTNQPGLPYRAEAAFEAVRLDQLLTSAQADQEAVSPPAEGHLRGAIDVSGCLDQWQQTQGRVHLEAEQMKIGRESLFGKALMVMQLRRPAEYIFTEMLIDALLEQGVLRSDRILLAGDNEVYQGNGTLKLADRSLRMELTAFGRRKGQEPTLLTALAENLGAALGRVEVTGTLDEPTVRQVPLPIFQRPFDLLGSPEQEN